MGFATVSYQVEHCLPPPRGWSTAFKSIPRKVSQRQAHFKTDTEIQNVKTDFSHHKYQPLKTKINSIPTNHQQVVGVVGFCAEFMIVFTGCYETRKGGASWLCLFGISLQIPTEVTSPTIADTTFNYPPTPSDPKLTEWATPFFASAITRVW